MKYIFTLSLSLLISSIAYTQNQPGLHVAKNHTVLFGQDTTSAGIKLLWYPTKAAFRAGRSTTTEWINANVGPFSTAFGAGTEARGNYSAAFGLSTYALSFGETSVGRFSMGGGSPTAWVSTDPLFEVGNGTSSSVRSNALTVYKNGNVEIQNSLKIGDHEEATPDEGTIRWNAENEDFEGWSGDEWKSLTKSNTWGKPVFSESCELIASDASTNSFFGWSVSISGSFAVVGAKRHAINGNASQGKAYIFEKIGPCWTEITHLTASDGTAYDNFGSSVAISNDLIVIGADSVQASFNVPGKAYLFKRPANGWPNSMTETTQLIIDNWANTDGQLGSKVEIFENQIAVSGKDTYLYNEPAAGWPNLLTQSTTLINPIPFTRGEDISFDDNTILRAGNPAHIYEMPISGWPSVMNPTSTLNNSTSPFSIISCSLSDGIAVTSSEDYIYLYEKSNNGWPSTMNESNIFEVPLSGILDLQILGNVLVSSSSFYDFSTSSSENMGNKYKINKDAGIPTISQTNTFVLSIDNGRYGFGYSLNFDNNAIFFGNPFVGKVYVFEKQSF